MLRPLAIAALAGLAGCSQASEPSAERFSPVARVPGPAPSTASASAAATPGGGGALEIESDDGVLEFSYSHPAEAGAIPALAAVLATERDQARAEARKDALADREGAKDGGFEFRPHSLGIGWKVVTSTPRFLSLSGSWSSYTGGAHGNFGADSLVWDREAGRRLEATDLFVSKDALNAAVRQPFCAGLGAARRRKGVEPPEAGGVFPRCIDPAREATVILGSTGRQAIDRIGFLIDPYVAGPYAEGDYEVTIPVTRAILAAVKPQYRGAFAAR